MGGLAAEAAGGDFKTGALAAGVNEALVDSLAQWYEGMDPEEKKSLLVMNSQVIGVLAATAQGGDEEALQTGAWVAGTATQYNFLTDHEMQNLARDLEGCQVKGDCTQVATDYFNRHLANEAELENLCNTSITACQAKAMEIYEAVYKWQKLGYYAELDGQAAKILQAFHKLNLASGPEATQAIALPSAQAFVEALGLNPDSAATKVAGVAVASFIAGKATSAPKDKYVPNAGSVGNMGEFLKQPGLGAQVSAFAQKTKQIYQGQSVYQASSPIGDYIAKGDRFYLDGMHKNHLEVFDSKGKFKAVLNLDGTYNSAKTSKAVSEGRRLAR